jgi:hypothetical protein
MAHQSRFGCSLVRGSTWCERLEDCPCAWTSECKSVYSTMEKYRCITRDYSNKNGRHTVALVNTEKLAEKLITINKPENLIAK